PVATAGRGEPRSGSAGRWEAEGWPPSASSPLVSSRAGSTEVVVVVATSTSALASASAPPSGPGPSGSVGAVVGPEAGGGATVPGAAGAGAVGGGAVGGGGGAVVGTGAGGGTDGRAPFPNAQPSTLPGGTSRTRAPWLL